METFDPRTLVGLAGIPVVIALVQLLKLTFPKLDSRFWPAISLAVAILWNEGVGLYLHGDLALMALLGVITGLSASGLYSHATTVADAPPPQG